jgi:hypothetical protein
VTSIDFQEDAVISHNLVPYQTLTTREEQRLNVSENRVLRISAPKMDEIIVGCRKSYNEELHNSHYSPYIIKKSI